MREIVAHKVNGCNDKLKVAAIDDPGDGGANHVYDIVPTSGNAKGVRIEFQNGPLGEHPNGLTNETLIALVIDRLQGFQRGKFSCRENALAITKLEEAMHWLHSRTNERVRRGVEGTHQV